MIIIIIIVIIIIIIIINWLFIMASHSKFNIVEYSKLS